MTVSIRSVTSGELVRDGGIGSAGSFAVRIGHCFHSNLCIAWTDLLFFLLFLLTFTFFCLLCAAFDWQRVSSLL